MSVSRRFTVMGVFVCLISDVQFKHDAQRAVCVFWSLCFESHISQRALSVSW